MWKKRLLLKATVKMNADKFVLNQAEITRVYNNRQLKIAESL
jgi:hypothetical protein